MGSLQRMGWAAVFLASMAGCGGGGDGAEPADKYVGTWQSDCQFLTSGHTSSGVYSIYSRNVEVISRVDGKTVGDVITQHTYTAADCSGSEASGPTVHQETWAVTGQAKIEGETVDRLQVTADWGADWKDIGVVRGDTLYTGISNGDAYPVAISPTSVRTRVH